MKSVFATLRVRLPEYGLIERLPPLGAWLSLTTSKLVAVEATLALLFAATEKVPVPVLEPSKVTSTLAGRPRRGEEAAQRRERVAGDPGLDSVVSGSLSFAVHRERATADAR